MRWLTRRTDSELVFVANQPRYGADSTFGNLWDLGFSSAPGQPISYRQPTNDPDDGWVIFNRFVIAPDNRSDGAGWIELHESLAYDLHYRSEVPWTGLKVMLHLSQSALSDYLEYVGDPKIAYDPADHFAPRQAIIFRTPARQFKLPKRRGGLDPKRDGPIVGRLNQVRRFRLTALNIQKLTYVGLGLPVSDGVPTQRDGLPPPLIIGLQQ